MDQELAQAVIDECVGNAHGNLARVTELVEQNPGVVNARATWNETPIEAATQMANRPMIDFLVERGATGRLLHGLRAGRHRQGLC